MINNIFTWVKTHKLLTFNLVVAAAIIWIFLRVFVSSSLLGITGGRNYNSVSTDAMYGEMDIPIAGSAGITGSKYAPSFEAAPQPDVADRKVVVQSNFSVLVKNVTESVEKIKTKTVVMAGYVVNTRISRAEYSESGVLEIRIPSDKVDEMSNYLRTLAVKVVSENVSGRDITDQYIDIERRISDLEKNKARMQEIMDQATTVGQMLEIQRSIDNVQNQIDSYKGQLIYMEGTTTTSKLTIHLSTDELSLPYAPEQPWRPEAIFKGAVRAMLGTLQSIGTIAIWVAVYSPIVLGTVVTIKVIKKFRKRKQVTSVGK